MVIQTWLHVDPSAAICMHSTVSTSTSAEHMIMRIVSNVHISMFETGRAGDKGWVCIWYGSIEAAKSLPSPLFDMQSDWCYINKLKCWEYNFTPYSPGDWSEGEINNRINSNHRKWRKCKMEQKRIPNSIDEIVNLWKRNGELNSKYWMRSTEKGEDALKYGKKTFFRFFFGDGRGESE